MAQVSLFQRRRSSAIQSTAIQTPLFSHAPACTFPRFDRVSHGPFPIFPRPYRSSHGPAPPSIIWCLRGNEVMRFWLILLVTVFCVRCAAAIKCYCTDDHCVPYGACDGAVCLVGILRENNQVIRTCGSRPLGCYRDEDERWTDLCACDQPFCNTFSYLRAHTSSRRESPAEAAVPEDIPLVFNRVDRPEGQPAPPQAPISTRTSFLTLLLVVVPLTVGGATVLVVSFNYYCHLC